MKQALIATQRPKVPTEFVGPIDPGSIIKGVKTGGLRSRLLAFGPNGSGKSTLCEIVARGHECQKPIGVSPCLTCEPCEMSIETGYNNWTTIVIRGGDLDRVNFIHLIDDLCTVPVMFPELSRRLVIEDLDHSGKKGLNGLPQVLDRLPATIMLFTATEVAKLPESFQSRCYNGNLGQYKMFHLVALGTKLAHQLDVVVEEPSCLEHLIRITNFNPRNLVNALQVIAELCLTIGSDLFCNIQLKENLGLTSGPERMNPT